MPELSLSHFLNPYEGKQPFSFYGTASPAAEHCDLP
ncbi:hypothetical protein EPYR_01626 [Erwinia pyrifoliae DSM 12163]|nr:hypothetical protein EPYR_01626 [Erwinia pyrifoliae DSM 12163]